MLSSWTGCALALVLFSTPAHTAVNEQELARCAAIGESKQRLRCFDRLTRELAPPGALRGGAIEIERLDDDGRQLVRLTLTGDKRFRGREVTAVPKLVIQCGAGRAEAQVVTGMEAQKEYGSEDKTVILRFDRDEPFTDRWSASADGKSLQLADAGMLIRLMAQRASLYLLFTPLNAGPASTNFDLEGFAEALEPFRELCGTASDR